MAKPRRLATTVYVAGRAWGPADDVPAEVAERITNPKAWASDEDQAPAETKAKDAGTKSGARLATTVWVDGRAYGPDDAITDDVAARIRNPKAWEGGKLPAGVEASGALRGPEPQTAERASSEAAGEFEMTPEQVQTLAAGEGQGQGPVAAPPRSGQGSGVAAWRAFAADQGVEVEDGASRDDIIAACERAGVFDEQ